MTFRRVIIAAIAASAVTAATPANAGYLNFADLSGALDNQASNTIGGFTYLAFSGPTLGKFGFKTLNGVTGMGVRNGPAQEEIDFLGNESVQIFSASGNATGLSSLTFGHIYNGPEWGDAYEVAQVVALLADGSQIIGRLSTGGTDSDAPDAPGIWEIGGVTKLVDCLGQDASGPGLCTVEDPFNGMSILGLTFTAIDNQWSNNSDYTLVSMAVPEPATVGLVGLGLLSFAGAIRRRRRS
jgi:hypothetical protein